MTHREESPRRVARWLADSFPHCFRRRRRPIVRRPEEARRFLPLLENMGRRESATLLSASGIGLAATEIALLNRPEDEAGSTPSRVPFASADLDQASATSLLAGSNGWTRQRNRTRERFACCAAQQLEFARIALRSS